MILELIKYYLYKLIRGKTMARPRVLRIDGGEIILKNLPKERGDEIIALITGTKNETEVDETNSEEANLLSGGEEYVETKEENLKSVKVVDRNSLLHTALGLNKNNSGIWELVSVKYNTETKEAEVESVKPYRQGEKQVAVGDLKVKIAKLML
jgi:hypothetical protein